MCKLVLGLIWASRRAARCCGFGRGIAPASDMPESDVYSRAAADTERITKGGGCICGGSDGPRGRSLLPAVSPRESRAPSCVADDALTSASQHQPALSATISVVKHAERQCSGSQTGMRFYNMINHLHCHSTCSPAPPWG